MRIVGLLALLGMGSLWAGEMPEKAAAYHAALANRPDSAQLFERFRDAWLEERSVEELEKELQARAEGKEAGAWAILARAYLAAGRTEDALAAFDKAREQSPAPWLDLESAGLRLAAKDFAAAEKAALAVPEGDPKRLDALKLAGLACLRAERIDDALAHWTQAVAAAPGDSGLLEDLTELTRREGRLDLALEYCGKWRDATNDAYGKAMATVRRSELLLGSQRFDEAMTELAEVFKVSADDSWLEREALARAEQAHRQRGDTTGWAKWIGAQADAHPARLNFRRTHSQALATAGQTDEALEVLTEVMRRAPGDSTVRWQRIGLLEQSLKLAQAYEECAELAAKEKSETAGLRLAELAFRLEKKAELKQALDGVLAAADSGKRVNLASLYARYGLPEGSEKIWREEAGGEFGGSALRQLAKHLKTAGREQQAIEVWKQLGARDVAQDRIDSAQMLAATGEKGAAREILESGREKFSAESGYEAAVADLAMVEGKPDEARAIYLKLARVSKQPEELAVAVKGWLRTSAAATDPLKDLGEATADRCLRAAWLAAAGKPLPPVLPGDELERSTRQALLREHGRWAEIVALMEAVPGERGPLLLSELAEAKLAAGNLPGALVTARAWRARVPDQPGPWLFEAGILEKLSQQADATVLLRRAAARFEDNEEVARRLFAVLLESLDPRESLEWAWKRHDRSNDESVRSGWLREILLVSKQREKLDDLKERFEERARRDPASPGPLVALAELAKARGDSRAELDLLRRAAVNAPRDLAVISALAAQEERSGETARALERYVALARLAPGPDSARQLAQAKIRLGDVEGGMRDLQALAGEKGLDLRALEQSAGDLAARGYVEEATRLLAAVDPAQRTARLNFVLGMLLEADGREGEAVDAFIKVMAEPDDPAETRQRAHGYDRPSRARQYSQMIQNYSGREASIPGTFNGLQVPESLTEAKRLLKSLLARLAMQHGGEIWTRAATVIPELAAATPEQWREAMEFARSDESGNPGNWWDFIKAHPGNPLGIELLVESSQIYQSKPEQAEALLKTNPPLRVQVLLRLGRLGEGIWRADNLEFLESIQPADLQDESIRPHVWRAVEQMLIQAAAGEVTPPISTTDCARGLAVLEKTDRVAPEVNRLHLLRARLALLEGQPDEFAGHVNAWATATGNFADQPFSQLGASYPLDAFECWREKVGDAAADAAIAKIESPVLRCIFSRDAKPEQRTARVNRELVALPKDAPMETRRALTRLKWSFHVRGEALSGALRKELEAAVADDSDPRLTFEANWQLISSTLREGEMAADDKLKLKELHAKLATSPDPGDQAYAAQFGGYFGTSSRSNRIQNPPAATTRWGPGGSFSVGNSRQNRLTLPAIVAMDDEDQATREAARFLENAARASAGRAGNLSDEIKALSDAGLVDAACDRISLPADAGLGRRVAILTLLDACAKTDRARSLLAEIAKSRPWETRWTVDLALRSADDAEMHRLLNSVAERGDFDRIMGKLISQDRSKPGELLSRLTRLVAWAPQAKGRRAWMQPAMMILAKGGNGGLQELAAKNENQLACFRRYVELALDDRRLAELGFRVVFAARRLETPEAVTAAARRALLAGAYTSTGRTFATPSMPGDMELAALEHLVLVATEKGDEAAFPADFRERLKVVDPESDAWLAKMLAAKTVTELPDVSNARAKSAGWVALARHEAAMLRAIKLPGRDAWLTEVFRRNEFHPLSQNLQHVIRQSLLDAGNPATLRDRVLALLEASAGPRKGWEKPTPKTDSLVRNAPATDQLPHAAAVILDGAKETNAATLLAVLDIFRETRVPVGESSSAFNRLGQWWQLEMTPPRKSTLAELLGPKRDAAYTLGVWQSARVPGGKPQFVWQLPQVLQRVQIPGREELAKAVKGNPDAGFLDLFRVGLGTNDPALQRRTLLKAAPDLAKLPAEIRRAVIDFLTTGMGAQDLKGLPAQAAAQLRENLDAARKQRVEAARLTYKRMKSSPPPSAEQSSRIGSMLGPVIGDDEAFVAEVLADWRPRAEADKSGNEIAALMSGIISDSDSGPEMTLTFLRLLDSLGLDLPNPSPRNSNWRDPLETLWSRIRPQVVVDPQFWRETAALSPRLQAQFWVSAPQHAENGNFDVDPKIVKSLREAAKGSEVTRTALEWSLLCAAMRREEDSKIDGGALVDFAKALNAAGSSTESIAALLCRGVRRLSRMENPGAVMAETPALLTGLKSLPGEHASTVIRGIQNLWEQVQRERLTASGNHSKPAVPEPVYPMETAALLKFALTRNLVPKFSSYHSPGMTPIVIATADAELLDLWIKFAGDALAGDLALIVMLLEKDRVAEAAALAPAAGRSFSSSRRFNSHLESLMPKLNSIPIPQAFGLMARLAMLSDASGAEAPAEQYPARKARLAADFERIRDSLTVADRAAFCGALYLSRTFEQKHVPALDEFASEAVAKDFRKLLLTGDADAFAAKLFVPAVCSRVFADDLSGIALLSTVIAAVPPGPRRASSDFQSSIYPIHRCLAAYANRHDAKLPKAAAEAILAYAAALADRKNPVYQGIVAQYVYLAATDPASLAAGLKTCGLDGQKPVTYNASGGYSFTLETYQAMMRVALLHPAASEELLASLGPPLNNGATTGALLPSLHDPKLRARISPALFLTWNNDLWAMTPEDREAIQLYATERRGDFDDAQRTRLDQLLRQFEQRDPARVREMRRRKMEESRLLHERENRRRIQE